MKLYYSKGACSLAIRITLHEIDVPCQYIAVDLKAKTTETGEDFLKINPKGAVPVLELATKELLTENSAIQMYLADEYKATPLLAPVGQFKRYRILEWLSFINSDLHKSCGPLFNSKLPEEIKQEFFIPPLKSKLAWLSEHLSKNKFLMSDQFTLVDGYLYVVLRWLPGFKIALADYPHLVRYMDEVKKRTSVQAALQEEGLT